MIFIGGFFLDFNFLGSMCKVVINLLGIELEGICVCSLFLLGGVKDEVERSFFLNIFRVVINFLFILIIFVFIEVRIFCEGKGFLIIVVGCLVLLMIV